MVVAIVVVQENVNTNSHIILYFSKMISIVCSFLVSDGYRQVQVRVYRWKNNLHVKGSISEFDLFTFDEY